MMLKRSKILVAFLVVTVLCASVGFAAVSDNLNATGKLSVDVTNSEIVEDFNADVFFSGIPEAEEGVTATIGTDTDELSIQIANTVLTSVGDSTTIKVTIENAGAYAVNLATPTTTNEAIANYASVTAALGATSLAADGGADTTTLTITVTLTAIPAASFTDLGFSAQVVATPAQ